MKNAKDRYSNLLRYGRRLEVSECRDRPRFPTIGISLVFIPFDSLVFFVLESCQVLYHPQAGQVRKSVRGLLAKLYNPRSSN